MVILDGLLRGSAGGPGEVLEAFGAGNVDTPMDGMDPGGAGIGDDDSRGPENGQPSLDAESWIPCPQGQRLAVDDADGENDIRASSVAPRKCADGLGHDVTRARIDRRLARCNGQSRLGHGADTLSGTKNHAASRFTGRHGDDDFRTMGDVGVISRILDHRGPRLAITKMVRCQWKPCFPAAWQSDPDRIRKRARGQCLVGCCCSRGGTGTGGPPPAQGIFRHVSCRTGYSLWWSLCRAVMNSQENAVMDRLSHQCREG